MPPEDVDDDPQATCRELPPGVDIGEWTRKGLQIQTLITLQLDVEHKVSTDETLENIQLKLIGEPEIIKRQAREFYVAAYEKSLSGKFGDAFRQLFLMKDQQLAFMWLETCIGEVKERNLLGLLDEQPNSSFLKNFAVILRTCNLPSTRKAKMFTKMRQRYFDVLDISDHLDGELGIYRCLRICTGIPCSKKFRNTVEALWFKCFNSNEILSIACEVDAEEHFEHDNFKKIVSSLKESYSIENQRVLEKILECFEPVKDRIIEKDRRKILEFKGREFEVSQILVKLNRQLEKDPDISEIRLVATAALFVDAALTLPEKNISVLANRIRVRVPVCWDLSGAHAREPPYFEPKTGQYERAKDGQNSGENGEDGDDGQAGNNSGNILIETTDIENSDRLSLRLCGGNGSRGQDGGNGCDGKNGVGFKHEETFKPFVKSLSRFAMTLDTLLYAGTISRLRYLISEALHDKTRPHFVDKISDMGARLIFTRSTHFANNHLFVAVLGTEGEPGGRGGRGGRRGGGGKKGCIEVISFTGEPLEHELNVTTAEGKDGKPGVNGQPGKHGRDGNDIVAACTPFEKWQDFGTKSNDSKVTIKFTDNRSEGYYVKQYDKGEGSLCYIKVDKVKKIPPSAVTENQDEERKEERQEKVEAMEAVSIDKEAINQQYADVFLHTNATVEENLRSETGVDADIEVHRVIRHAEVPPPPPYSPKLRHPCPMLLTSEVQEMTASETLPDKLWSAPLEDADPLTGYKASKQQRIKVQEKILVTHLRQQHLDYNVDSRSENASRTTESDLDLSALTSKVENLNRDCFRFLARVDEEPETIHACLATLFNSNQAKQYIEEIISEATMMLVSKQDFLTFEKVLMNMKQVRFGDNSVVHFLPRLRQVCFYLASNTAFASDEDKASFKTEIEEEFAAITKGVRKDDMVRLEAKWREVRGTIVRYDFLNQPKNQFPLSQLEVGNSLPQFAYAFCRLFRLVEINWYMAKACMLADQLVQDEARMVHQKRLPSEKEITMRYLSILVDKTERDRLFGIIKTLKDKCSAGRLLIAFRTRANLRIYADRKLIEDHFAEGERSFHVEISEQHQFHWLNFEKRRLELFEDRRFRSQEFLDEIRQCKFGNALSLLGISSIRMCEVCTNCAYETSREQAEVLDTKTYQIVHFVNGNHLQDILNVFLDAFPDVGPLFISILHTIFTVDGAHIDAEELEFILNVAIETCRFGGSIEWTLVRLLLENAQDKWLEAFFVLSIENALLKKLEKKVEIIEKACGALDKRMLILVSKKLDSEKLCENDILDLLGHLKHARAAYHELLAIPLSNWVGLLKESHIFYLLEDQCCHLPEETRKKYMNWCLKISGTFGPTEAENVLAILLEGQFEMEKDERVALNVLNTVMLLDNEGITHLVQCLCHKEFESSTWHSPTNVFKVLSQISLDRKPSKASRERINCVGLKRPEDGHELQDTENSGIAKEVVKNISQPLKSYCLPYRSPIMRMFDRFVVRLFGERESPRVQQRSVEALNSLMKNNDTQSFTLNSGMYSFEKESEKQQYERQQNRKRMAVFNSITNDLNVDKDGVRDIAKKLLNIQAGEAHTEPSKFYTRIKNAIPKSMKEDEMLLILLDEAIYKQRGFCLRNNQKIAILLALRGNEIAERGVLEEIATGEGKSLIITSLAIISVLRGHSVHILSSSSSLAKRDVEAELPLGCTDIYSLFGVTAGHICVESSKKRREVYANSDVVYGDIAGFQRDCLLDKFYGKKIRGKRVFDTIIIDEVDSMLLDKGNNMLYLSHELPELEFLQPLFVRIWYYICMVISQDSTAAFNTDLIVKRIRSEIFATLPLDDLEKVLGVKEIAQLLISSKVIDETGVVQARSLAECSEKLGQFEDKQIANRVQFYLKQIFRSELLPIPEHLRSFVDAHLKDFVLNAKAAYFMQEGCGYQVDIANYETSSTTTRELKVVIVDQSTGVDLLGSQWSNGLHQFLQLKHGLRLTALSLKAVFISNVSFIVENYKHVFGFSGTLGAEAEQIQLKDLYKVDCIKIPSSSPRKLHEERSIVTMSPKEHIKEMFTAILQKLQAKRSVLVICETIRQVDDLSIEVKRLAQQELAENNPQRGAFETMVLYRRDRDIFEYGNGSKELESCKIIFATNLAGRGTDIKLQKELVENGGLHVIVAFLPGNVRIEEQAFGRAARCGEPGSAQLVFHNDKENNIDLLKTQRNSAEAKRVLTITNFYKRNICVEERCFHEFTKCFNAETQSLNEEKMNDDLVQLLQRDLLDRWAMWLDKAVPETTELDEEGGRLLIASAENFCSSLTLLGRKPCQPMNRLRWGVHSLLKKEYESAREDFDHILAEYSFFAPEAHYYLAFIIIKKNEIVSSESLQSNFAKVKQHFLVSKRAFEARVRHCNNDRAVVNVSKKGEDHKHFVIDIFDRQQEQIIQMYEEFLEGIEGLLGAYLSHEKFMGEFVKEEIAFALFKKFGDAEHFKMPPIKAMRFAPTCEEADLSGFADAHCLSEEAVRLKLIQIHRNKESVVDGICTAFPIPTREIFWEELKELGCLRNEQTHIFVNERKFDHLNPKLVDRIREYLLQRTADETSALSRRLWLQSFDSETFKECDPQKLQIQFSRIFDILTALKVIVVTKSAEFETAVNILRDSAPDVTLSTELQNILQKRNLPPISANSTHKVENFKSFSFIVKDDLLSAGIPANDCLEILAELVHAEVLAVDSQGKLRIVQKMNPATLQVPECYKSVLVEIVKQKCAFVNAFREISERVQQGVEPKISLLSKDDIYANLFDLVEIGVLEPCNVNLEAFQTARKDATYTQTAKGLLTSDHESYNVKALLEEVCNNFTSAIDKHTENLPLQPEELEQSYKESTEGFVVSKIVKAFYGSSGHQKFETVDAELIELWKRLSETGLGQLRTYCLYVCHGPSHIIVPSEKKWSAKSMAKLGVVFGAALAQLAAGGVLLACTYGAGTPVANAVINEGIGDLLYVLRGVYTGYPGSYKRHKMMSMACSAVFCGVAVLSAGNGGVNAIAHSLRGGAVTVKTAAGASVNFATLSGGQLIANVGLNTVAVETSKQVLTRVSGAVLSVAIFSSLQWALDGLIKKIIRQIANRIICNVEEAINSNEHLKNAIFDTLSGLGRENGERLVRVCFDCVVYKGGITFWDTLFDQIFHEYRPFIIAAINATQNSSDNSWLGIAKKYSPHALSLVVAVKCFTDLRKKTKAMINNLATKLEEKASVSIKAEESNTDEFTQRTVYENARTKLLDEFKSKVKEKLDKMVEIRIVTPLLTLAAAYCQQGITALAMAGYRHIKEGQDFDKLERFKEEYEREKHDISIGEEEARAHFEAKLTDLMETTRSPEVMARLIDNGVKIEGGMAAAVSELLAKQFKQSVEVRVRSADGEIFSHRAEGDNPSVKVLELDLKDEHYSSNKEPKTLVHQLRDWCFGDTPQNPCLYDALRFEDKRVSDIFTSDASFRHALADSIANDPYFRMHIQEGWHSISVQRRQIGGAPDEFKDNQELLQGNDRSLTVTNDVETSRKEVMQSARGLAIKLPDVELKAVLRGSRMHYDVLRTQFMENMKTIYPIDGRLRAHSEFRENTAQMVKAMEKLYDNLTIPDFSVSGNTSSKRCPIRNQHINEMQQQVCNEIVHSISKHIHAKPAENDTRSRFAVFVLDGETGAATIFIAANYYSASGKALPVKLLDEIKQTHGKQLVEAGIKTISFVERNTKGQAATIAAKQNRPIEEEDRRAIEYCVPVEMLVHFVALERSALLCALAVSRTHCSACPDDEVPQQDAHIDINEHEFLLRNMRLQFAEFSAK